MKISIGTNIKEGPWGGGNLFAQNLKNYFENKGHNVITNLLEDDIDIILITEPRRTSESSAYTNLDVLNYIKYVNEKSLVVHRINECDERKGTNFVNKYLIEANKVADQTIFVSTWLKNLFLNQGINTKNNDVILGGANIEIFNKEGYLMWDKKTKLKLVTHHWGGNWNKGFETYSKIDDLLSQEKWKDKIDFTYIGNTPKKFSFKNSTLIEPKSGLELAKLIKSNHVYITGSLNEPSGNHHIEGAQCGLPLMYIDSGGMSEYCHDYGIEFTVNNLEEKISEMIENYDLYVDKVKKYKFSSDIMCNDYETLFLDMLDNREFLYNLRSIEINKNKIFETFYLLKRKRSKLNYLEKN